MEVVLNAENLIKHFGKGDNLVKAVNDISMNVFNGEFVTIQGASGSGKSTLFHMLGGIDAPDSGKVVINDVDIYSLLEEKRTIFRRKNIGFVFQQFNLIKILNVYENIVLPVEIDNKKVDENYLNEVIEILGLKDKIYSLPGTLSGGQQQRTAIARALVGKPKIILADEPTGNLDSNNSYEVLSLLKQSIKRFNQTLVMITHSEEIARLSDRTIFIRDGQIVGETSWIS